MKAFKGFNRDMTCRGFQYKEGETFETDKVELCSTGFHACERPLDVFNYYSPSESVYHEVELDEVSDERRNDDTKVVAKKIKVGARLSIRDLVNAQIEFVKEHCTNEFNAEPGQPATAGENGAATAGENGAATAGYRGAATAGNYGAATSRGKSSVGKNGLAVARGNGCKVRGGLGSILIIAEESPNDYDIVEWASAVVDGEIIKADTWYRLVGGKFMESEDE